MQQCKQLCCSDRASLLQCSQRQACRFRRYSTTVRAGTAAWIIACGDQRIVCKGKGQHSYERDEDMRKYEEGQDKKLTEVVCNRCGRKLKVENGYLREECVAVDKTFGYFSRRDGASMHFDLCEDCCDELMALFAVPAETVEETELL